MGWGRRLSALYEYRAAADCGGGEHAAAEGALAPFGGQTFRSPEMCIRDSSYWLYLVKRKALKSGKPSI